MFMLYFVLVNANSSLYFKSFFDIPLSVHVQLVAHAYVLYFFRGFDDKCERFSDYHKFRIVLLVNLQAGKLILDYYLKVNTFPSFIPSLVLFISFKEGFVNNC